MIAPECSLMITVFACPYGRLSVTAEQDLTVGPHSHSLRRRTIVDGDRENSDDLLSFWIDHRNCTDPSILAAKLGNADIEFAGPRTPLALLNAIRSRCTIIAVKYDLPTRHNNRVVCVEMRLTNGGTSALFAAITR